MPSVSYKRLKRPWLGRLSCDVCSELAMWIGTVDKGSSYLWTCGVHKALPIKEIHRRRDEKNDRIS